MQRRVESFLDNNFNTSAEQVAELDGYTLRNAQNVEGYFGMPKEVWLRMTMQYRRCRPVDRTSETMFMSGFACGWLMREGRTRK